MMNTIRNYVQLTANIATSGQPTAQQFQLIAASGYQTVINLAMPHHSDTPVDESLIVTDLGMTYIHIPVPFDRPAPQHVRKFCLLMQGLAHEKVWAHCIMNYRVSAFMYHYLSKFCGVNDIEATSPIFEQWQPDAVWHELLAWNTKHIMQD